MAASTDNKALDQLIKKFTEVSNETKELDKVIANFSTVIEEFHVTMLEMEDKVKVNEITSLSKEAVERLKEIKSYNELQLLDKLDTVVKKQVSAQLKPIQKQIADHSKDSAATINKHFQKITSTLEAVNTEEKDQVVTIDQSEILSLLQKIDYQTRFSGSSQVAATQQNNEEVIKLRKSVSILNQKLKKIESDYEERISLLENEIELLKANHNSNTNNQPSTTWIEIDDEDLPF